MVKFILPLAFFLSGLLATTTYATGICDHVDLEVIKDRHFTVDISAEGYETSRLIYDPIKYQGCNVEPKEKGQPAMRTLDVKSTFYFFKGQFTVSGDVADAMQAAFDRGEAVQLRFANDSLIQLTGEAAQ